MERVAVVGGESTGGRLVARLLTVDETLEVRHWSLPHGPRSSGLHWPFEEMKQWNPEQIVVTVRDWDASLLSKIINHQPDHELAVYEQRRAYELLFDFLSTNFYPWRFLVFESLVLDPATTTENLWRGLGRSPRPLTEPIYNANIRHS